MTLLAGTCVFSEVGGRRGARVFMLCQKPGKREPLIPVAAPGETFRGVRMTSLEDRLTLRMEYLPAELARLYFGISIPNGRDLGVGEPLILGVTPESGRTIQIPLQLRGRGRLGKRYALLAVARKGGGMWNVERLTNPEIYTDRTELATAYLLPSWWSSRRV